MAIFLGIHLSEDDMDAIRAHNFKVTNNLGARMYSKLSCAFPTLNNLPSLKRLRTHIKLLSGIEQCATIVASGHVAALLDHMWDLPNVRIVGRHEEQQRESLVRHSPTFPSSHALSPSIGIQPLPRLCNIATTTSRGQGRSAMYSIVNIINTCVKPM
jgi:hypothetical protein